MATTQNISRKVKQKYALLHEANAQRGSENLRTSPQTKIESLLKSNSTKTVFDMHCSGSRR